MMSILVPSSLRQRNREQGAIVVFDGVVRDDEITEMELEAYEDIAIQELEKIARDATDSSGSCMSISSIGSDGFRLVRIS